MDWLISWFTFNSWPELTAKAGVGTLIAVGLRAIAAWSEFLWKVRKDKRERKERGL